MNPPRTILRKLKIIHLAMVLSLIVFGLFIFFQNEGFVFRTNEGNDVFLYLVPIVALGGYFGSQIIVKKIMSNLRPEDGMENKLAKYQSATLLRFVCIEVPALLALVAFFLTNNALHLVIAICMVAYLMVQRPNKSRLFSDVPLDFEEQKRFDTLNH